ncbi:MAG: LrgB family protein [Solobacterium sp.]|nr:LrgB family protein [Erysipelotrichaceae bacterium]MBQ9153918.1 LrgB family protein [Solobacterium sp.]
MNGLFAASASAGAMLSLLAYWIGMKTKEKLKFGFLNPLLISIIIVIIFLLVFHVDYQTYYSGAKYLSWFLTPATVSLAIPLYQQIDRLKKNIKAILISILIGSLTSMGSILLFSLIFGFSHTEYVTFLPKSITTAIGMSISEEMGGNVAITVAAIIVTGIFGNMIGPGLCKALKITNPVAVGLAIGTSAHAIGTSKAMELGETEGAMSSLSIAVAGIITVIFVNVFVLFL